MKILFTENELLSMGIVYDYSPDVIVVGNLYDESRIVFTREGEYWRKAGKLSLGDDESLHQWAEESRVEYARAESTHGELVAVTSTKTYWVFSRNALLGLNIPVYRKVTEKAPPMYYLWRVPHVQIYLSTEEAAALDWVKY